MKNKAIGINSDNVKYLNRYSIIKYIRKKGSVSRVDIANDIGLTQAAVTIITAELLKEGVIVEKGEEANEKKAGRKKVMLEINDSNKYILGVYIDIFSIEFAISSLGGEIISYEICSNDMPQINAANILVNKIKEFISKSKILLNEILTIGISIVGIVDSEKGISINSFGVFEKNINLEKIIYKKIGVPALVDNNVRALAFAETYLNKNERQIFGAFIKHAPGLGLAMLNGESILKGIDSNYSNIAHTIVDINGEKCPICGKIGCLETITSEKSIINKAIYIFSESKTEVLFKTCKGDVSNVNIEKIIYAATHGDGLILSLLKETFKYIAIGTINTLEIIGGNDVVFYGKLFKDDFIFKILIDEIKKISSQGKKYNIYKSIHNEKMQCIGSIVLGIKKYFKVVAEGENNNGKD